MLLSRTGSQNVMRENAARFLGWRRKNCTTLQMRPLFVEKKEKKNNVTLFLKAVHRSKHHLSGKEERKDDDDGSSSFFFFFFHFSGSLFLEHFLFGVVLLCE